MIKKTSVTEQVIEFFKENISQDNWKVNSKIPSETKLSQSLGVSRATVRVAIQQFIAIGVLESIQGKGTFVKSNNLDAFKTAGRDKETYDISDICMVMEFRLVVEPGTCELAARNATKENIDNLKFYLNEMRNNVGNSESFAQYDISFHEEICRSSGNKIIENCLKDIFKLKCENHKHTNNIFPYKDGIYYHSIILDAIKEKNEKKARKYMEEHLKSALQELREHI